MPANLCMMTQRNQTTNNDELPWIGAPARGALEYIGVTKLSQVIKMSEAELLQVHGIGPKAVSLLKKELDKRKLSLKAD